MEYTNSSLVSYTKISPNKNVNRQNATYNPSGKITKITPHHMAGNLSVETCGNVFAPTSRGASSNYGIGSDGRIAMYVEEKDRSWCSSSPANDYNAVTIEVANDVIGGNWHVSDAAFNSLVKLCVDICKRNGIEKLVYTGDSSGNLTKHKMFAATSCPGPYLESKFPELAERVNAELGVSGGTPSDNTIYTEYTVVSGDSLWKIAQNLLGDGTRYKEIKILNGLSSDTIYTGQVLKIPGNASTPSTPSTPTPTKSKEEVAKAVIRGDYGNGNDRKTRLEAEGYNYEEIQALVNSMLSGDSASSIPSTPAKKSNETIANEVLAGNWGNGSDRKAKLEAAGYDYNAIQAIVNQKLGISGGSSTPTKSKEEVARAVIRGDYGNGAERKQRLEAEGYNYSEIQALVNSML